MNSKTFHYILIGVFVLILGSSVGVVALGNQYLHHHADTLKELKIQTSELEVQNKAYRQAKADVEAYSSLSAVIDKAIPTEKDQASIILEIDAIAKQCGITIKTIQFPTSQLGAAASAATPSASAATPSPTPAAAAPSGSDKTTGPSGQQIATEQAAAAQAASLSTQTQITAVDGFVGIGAIKTTLTPLVDDKHVVSYNQLIKFLQLLETNQRTMQVATLHLSPLGKSTNSSISFSLDLNIYTKTGSTASAGTTNAGAAKTP